MKLAANNFLGFVLVISFCLLTKISKSQNNIPAEVTSIVNMKLEDGQNKLTSLGYEVCSSSLFGRKQGWYDEKNKICISLKFDKSKDKKITEVVLDPNVTECQKALEASRAVWLKYHDGQAPVNTAKINEERKKLTEKGFVVSYWIDEISPGRSSEYWVNETTKKVMFIVWETQTNNWVMTNSSEYKMGQNPAPKKK